MGGIGSGSQWRSVTTLEETRRLDIRQVKKAGLLSDGVARTWGWNVGGEPNGSIQVWGGEHFIKLVYKYREQGDEWQPIEQSIRLESTACHYGGSRKWFVCPGCQRRVGILSGYGKYFYCRHCYKLPYGSQNEIKIDRLIRARRKLEERIFDETGYQKKKGMHWKTFDRLYDHYQALDDSINTAIMRLFGAVNTAN